MGFKKAWDYDDGKKCLIADVEFLEGKNEKTTETLYQREEKIVKPMLQGEVETVLKLEPKNPFQYTHFKKDTIRTLTTASVDYKRKLIKEKSKIGTMPGEDLANIQPISNTVSRPKIIDVH